MVHLFSPALVPFCHPVLPLCHPLYYRFVIPLGTSLAAKAMQQQLDNVSKCLDQDSGSPNCPNKTQTPWFTLDNRMAGKAMPAVTFAGVSKRTNLMRHPETYFCTILTNREYVKTKALKCKKGLSVLKAMSAKILNHTISSYCACRVQRQ